MKDHIAALVKEAALRLGGAQDCLPRIDISVPQEQYGDYSTNIALVLAPRLGKHIYEVASAIANDINLNALFEKVEATKNGFVNFKLSTSHLENSILEVIRKDKDYGKSTWGKGKKVLIEFVSANPTGPLHVGHGRWAVIGDDVASLLESCGFKVEREFYVNDVGNQIEKLESSVIARINGQEIPEGGYGGNYVRELAEKLKNSKKDLRKKVLELLLADQKIVLNKMGVKFNKFYSEETLHRSGKVQKAINELKLKGKTIVEEGALWFKSQEYGDDKNRVLVKETGETTYFASDIAYHIDKFKRGYDQLIDVWGADHHGYVPRLKAALKALDLPVERFEVIVGQLVSLFRGKEMVKMSKRTGDMITLDEVVDEVGRDAARFFMTMTSVNTHLEFDLELAKQKAQDNPVYYVQYAHARISSILREAKERKFPINAKANLSLLNNPSERKLMKKLIDLEDVISTAARRREPHMLVEYARSLSAIFHNFYHSCRVLSSDPNDKDLSLARLKLVCAARIVLKNVLELLKVSAPERM